MSGAEKMIVIVPSRGRPENAARLLDAWEATGAVADLLFCLDNDDPALDDYPRGTPAERLGLVGTLNHYARRYSERLFDYIGFMGDDHLPRTPHWDQKIVDVLASRKAAIAYGDDLHQGSNIPTAVFMTSNIIQALGYMAPPRFQHLYIDNVWREWGEGLGEFHYLPGVVIEHMHPDAGKAQRDSGYEENNSAARYAHDQAQYWDYCKDGLRQDIHRLKGLL